MSQTIQIAGATYPDVPSILVPKQGGGSAVFADPSGTTAVASDVAQGKLFLNSSGVLTTGTASGGGPTPVEPKDVNFIDYDGTILYSYTAQEAAALSDLPANPSHAGLTAQGWNYTLAQMKAEVTAQGKCTVGQMYVTDDGKTRLYIRIPDTSHGVGLTFYVRYTQTVTKGVEVDWGDGTAAETFTGTSATNRSHTYAQPGDYIVTLKVLSGSVSFVGSNSNAIYGAGSNYYNRARIFKAEFGSNVTGIGNYALNCCGALESVTIPKDVTSIGNYAFSACYALKSVTIPKDVTSLISTFYLCHALKSVSIPSGVTSIGAYTFQSCYLLSSVVIPSGVTSLGNYAFSACYVLESVVIPSGVTSIGTFAFSTCYNLEEIHFKPTTPPTVSNSNAWNTGPSSRVIYVPYSADHSVLNEYQAASNYPSPSTYTYIEE